MGNILGTRRESLTRFATGAKEQVLFFKTNDIDCAFLAFNEQ